MEQNKVANEIENGFKEFGNGVKIAGKKRMDELVAKNGYVAFKNPEAVAAFRRDPTYANWKNEYINGEYRFYPPEKEENLKCTLNEQIPQIETSQILETYKQIITDPTQNTFITVVIFQNDPSKCKYTLSTMDKKTGERKIIQEAIVDFNGKFSMETLPSLYNQLCNGIPAIDYEKEKQITFQSFDTNKVIAFGNLTPTQKQLIKNMKEFVDNKNLQTTNEKTNYHR